MVLNKNKELLRVSQVQIVDLLVALCWVVLIKISGHNDLGHLTAVLIGIYYGLCLIKY